MNAENISAEWARAVDSLKSAQLLYDEELYADAVSRSYYSVMHAARAALLAHDVVSESHRALRRLFGDVLVQNDSIEAEWARILGVEQDRRIAADYNADMVWEAADCQQLITDARRFMERMRVHLRQMGVDLLGP